MSRWGKISKVGHDDYIITVTYTRKKWILFGENVPIKGENKYRGSCGCWNSYPDGASVDVMTRSWFCDLWQAEIWREGDLK